MATLKEVISCTSDYDPDALPVAKANAVIRSFVKPVSGVERLPVRAALGRILAKDLISPINVPSHDNSAMDGYAVRNDDLGGGALVTTLTEIGTAFAGKEFAGDVKRGECVRVMTGAVMPKNTDTVVIQEAVSVEGKRVTIPAGQEVGQNRRLAGEDLRKGRPALRSGRLLRPADIGMIASLGIGEVSVRQEAQGRVLLHRRRAGVGRKKAESGRSLRFQPLHALGHAAAPRLRSHRPRRGARRAEEARGRVPQGRVGRRRGRHLGRRVGGRGRFHQADDGEARRSGVLENRHAPGPADGLRPGARAREIGVSLRPPGQSRLR